MIFNFFRLTDKKIFKKLGNIAFIRNGVGYGFISNEDLYHNCHIEIGFGRTTSGYGDWGGGFDRAVTSPLKIVIDKNYNIISSKTDSFYNSKSSQVVEWIAKKIQSKLGDKLIVKDNLLKECIDTVFDFIPSKSHIGLDVKLDDAEHTRNMLKYFTDKKQKHNYNFEDSKYGK